MKALIKKLVETAGPCGYEGPVRELVKTEIASLVDDLRIDALGNLIARKGEKSQDGLRILLTAHMDETGLMVSHVDEHGFARFTMLGQIPQHPLIGARVRFLNGACGVIGGERLENGEKLHSLEQVFIDTGAKNRAESPVRIGDVAVFDQPFLDLGKRMLAKALDNRAGVAALIEVIRKLRVSPHEITFAFTTQEEPGERGASVAAYRIDPQLALSIDASPSGDTPKARSTEISLGKGPAIKVRDTGMIANPGVVRWMIETADNAKIAYQLEIREGGTSEARAVQISRGGVPTGCVSIPCRYDHTPSEMIDLSDVQNSVKLVTELISRPISFL